MVNIHYSWFLYIHAPGLRVLARHNREQYFLAIFDDEWKLVQTQESESLKPKTHLFRVFEDPYEQADLAAQFPEVVEQLLSTFRAMPKAAIVGIDDPPIPTRTGLGGPMSRDPDDRPAGQQGAIRRVSSAGLNLRFFRAVAG